MLNQASAASTPTDVEKDACSLTGSVSQDWQRQRSPSDDRPEKKGTLFKWTNYIQGWQQRYIVLSNGTLSYYKSEFDTTFGCRGSMSLLMATVQPHEFDNLRFDVSVTDCIYYLRCESATERQEWLAALQQAKDRVQQDHGYGSDAQSLHSPISSLARGNSLLSLTSVLSNSSSTSKPSRVTRLKEKLLEMETFRDLLQHQMDNLQQMFDQCLESGADLDSGVPKSVSDENDDDDEEEEDSDFVHDERQAMLKSRSPRAAANVSVGRKHPRSSMASSIGQCTNYDHRCCDVSRRLTQQSSDLRSELITFRATTTGVLSTLTMCSDLFQRKDDRIQRLLEHERDRRQRLEIALRDCQEKLRVANEKWQRQAAKGGPDFQEGPHSMMREDEFLDAFEGELERLEQEETQRTNSYDSKESDSDAESTQFHAYQEMLEEKLQENVRYGYEEVTNLWSVAFEDGDLKVYRRDLEEGGVVVDPLKAYHCVPGITAYELCSVFFDDSCRMEWETTIESIDVQDRYGNDTLVAHQVLKRVWPSTQRDIVFLSALRELPPRSPDEHGFGYVVCNFSVEHPSAPITSKCVRAHINVAMLAHTFVTGVEGDDPIDRSNLMCRITYSANVNPGGWAPPSVVRAISKREYPKFLRRFSSYATSRVEGQPIQFDPSPGCAPSLA